MNVLILGYVLFETSDFLIKVMILKVKDSNWKVIRTKFHSLVKMF